MKKAFGILVISCAILSIGVGCKYLDGIKKANHAIQTIEQAEKTAAPLLAMLQDEIPGWDGFDADRKLSLLNKFNTVEEKGESLRGFIIAVAKSGLLPAKVAVAATGIGDAIGVGLGAIGIITGIIQKLKARRSKKVAVVAMRAGEVSKNGYGSAIAQVATDAGIRDHVENLYLAEVKK